VTSLKNFGTLDIECFSQELKVAPFQIRTEPKLEKTPLESETYLSPNRRVERLRRDSLNSQKEE
jgi:hypothetical protein